MRPASDPQPLALTVVDLFVIVWLFWTFYFIYFRFVFEGLVLLSFDCLFRSNSRLARIHRFNNTSSYGPVVGGVIESVLILKHIQLSRRR